MHDIEYTDILLTTEGGLHIMTQNLVQYNSRGHSWLVLYYGDVSYCIIKDMSENFSDVACISLFGKDPS
jgi:hypothetical protein